MDEICSIDGGYSKLKLHCMIGSLKPASCDQYRTLAIGTDPHAIFYHYLKKRKLHLWKNFINGITYEHAYEKFDIKSEEKETPKNNMVVELEIINVYEIVEEIRRLGGTVLDVDTYDCQPLIEQVLKRRNIEGRGGTGKSLFIKKLHEEVDKNRN